MRMDDMILVSIDDHMIEPPDMYRNHVPAKWANEAPKVVRNEQGLDEWVFQGEKTSTTFGMAATVGHAPCVRSSGRKVKRRTILRSRSSWRRSGC